jgi:hypothetical protein
VHAIDKARLQIKATAERAGFDTDLSIERQQAKRQMVCGFGLYHSKQYRDFNTETDCEAPTNNKGISLTERNKSP